MSDLLTKQKYKASSDLVIPISLLYFSDEFISLSDYIKNEEDNVIDVIKHLIEIGEYKIDDIIFSAYQGRYEAGNEFENKLNEINEIRNVNKLRKFDNYENFIEIYNEWLDNINKEFKEEQLEYQKLLKSENIIFKQPKYYQSPISVIESTISLEFIENEVPNNEIPDNVVLFDDSHANIRIPYISYFDGKKEYTKIYKSYGENHDYNLIRDKYLNSYIAKQNDIYILIWKGNNLSDGNYTVSIYRKNEFTLQTGLDDQKKMIKYISNTFNRDLRLKEIKNIQSRFFLYDVQTQPNLVLLDVISTDENLSYFIKYNEISSAYPFQQRVNLTLDFDRKITFSYNFLNIEIKDDAKVLINNEEEDLKIINGKTNFNKLELSLGSDYIEILLNGQNYDEIKYHANIINHVFNYINNNNVLDYYKDIVNINDLEVQTRTGGISLEKIKTGRKGNVLLQRLKKECIFDFNARSCEKRRQPRVLTEEEINNVVLDDNGYEGKMGDKSVLVYPKPGESENECYLVCDTDEKAQYPGLNKHFNVCCYNNKRQKTNSYSQYYKGTNKKQKTESKSFGGDKISVPNHVSLLPPNLVRILKYGKKTNYYRLGVSPESPNSFLHSILVGINDIKYCSNFEKRERYIKALRYKTIDEINLNILKQELYDWKIGDIKKYFKSNSFLDSFLVYKIYEEIFNINIFVFYNDETRLNTQLEIPRNKIFHIRQFNPNRKTLLLYKHWGSDSDKLKYPQYELISTSTEADVKLVNKFNKIYDSTYYQFIYSEIYQKTQIISSWDKELNYRQNFYQGLKFEIENPISQHIDNYGKLRGINYKDITIFFPPSQPMNLPIDRKTKKPTIKKLITLLGFNPQSVDVKDGMITGLWYFKELIYVPVKHENFNEKYIIGPRNPMYSEEISLSLEYKDVKKEANKYLEIVTFLAQIYNGSLDNFLEKEIIIGREKYNPGMFDFNNLPRYITTNYKEALNILKNSGIIKKGKIYTYNKWFYASIRWKLIKFFKQKPEEVIFKPRIRSYYDINDFKEYKNEMILIGNDEMKNWLKFNKRSDILNILYKTIQLKNMYDNFTPYIFLDTKTNRKYIVQYVEDSTLENAYKVSKYWIENEINIASNKEFINDYDVDINDLVMYTTVDLTNELILLQDLSNTDKYVEVIKYKTILLNNVEKDYFASLLPLPN